MVLVNLTFEQRKCILKCYWKTENVDYPPRSPDLTPLDFFLWGAVKNAVYTVYTSKPSTLPDVRREIETACAAVHKKQYRTTANLPHVVVNNALLLVVDILNICDFKRENITILYLCICEL
jgi:hypothetical protein